MKELSAGEAMSSTIARLTLAAVGRNTPVSVWRSDLAAVLAERAELLRSLTKIAEWQAMEDNGDARLIRACTDATKEAATHGYHAAIQSRSVS